MYFKIVWYCRRGLGHKWDIKSLKLFDEICPKGGFWYSYRSSLTMSSQFKAYEILFKWNVLNKKFTAPEGQWKPALRSSGCALRLQGRFSLTLSNSAGRFIQVLQKTLISHQSSEKTVLGPELQMEPQEWSLKCRICRAFSWNVDKGKYIDYSFACSNELRPASGHICLLTLPGETSESDHYCNEPSRDYVLLQ